MKYPKLIHCFHAFVDVLFVKYVLVSLILDNILIYEAEFMATEVPYISVLIKYRVPIMLFIYYFSMEYATGRTLGKFITRTKVISTLTGENPTLLQMGIRTFLRFIPIIDALTFFGKEGLHDHVSDTKLVYASLFDYENTNNRKEEAIDKIKDLLLEVKIANKSPHLTETIKDRQINEAINKLDGEQPK